MLTHFASSYSKYQELLKGCEEEKSGLSTQLDHCTTDKDEMQAQHKESQQFSEDMVTVLQKCEAEKKILELLNETLAYQLSTEKFAHEKTLTGLNSCETDHEILANEVESMKAEKNSALVKVCPLL